MSPRGLRNLTGSRAPRNNGKRLALLEQIMHGNVRFNRYGNNGEPVWRPAPLFPEAYTLALQTKFGRLDFEKQRFSLDRYMRALIDRDPLTTADEKKMLKRDYIGTQGRTEPMAPDNSIDNRQSYIDNLIALSAVRKGLIERLNLRRNVGGRRAFQQFTKNLLKSTISRRRKAPFQKAKDKEINNLTSQMSALKMINTENSHKMRTLTKAKSTPVPGGKLLPH